jgi:hypothetical protein
VLAIAVLANLGDWLRAAIPDGLRATFVLVRPPDGLRANVPNVRGDEHGFRWAGAAPKFEEFIRHAKERRQDNPAERPLA